MQHSSHSPSSAGAAKAARHRHRQRAAGLRPVQFWVPDSRSAEFASQLASQCLGVNGTAQETAVLAFTEEAASLIEGWK